MTKLSDADQVKMFQEFMVLVFAGTSEVLHKRSNAHKRQVIAELERQIEHKMDEYKHAICEDAALFNELALDADDKLHRYGIEV